MPNQHRGFVEVELDGKTHRLRYDLNALAVIEERLALPSISSVMDILNQLSMRALRCLLWGGLLHERPELTEQEVGEMDFDFAHVVDRVSKAVVLAFKTDGGEAPPEGNARRPGRGSGPK